jgi:pilus assembly protein CpaC
MIALSKLVHSAAAMALLVGIGRPSLANGLRGSDAAGVVAVATDEQAVARKLDLSIGRSLIIDLPRDAKEVFRRQPKVANAVVAPPAKVFVHRHRHGATSIFVMDAEGRQIAALDVNVGRDLNVLSQTLRNAMPQAQFLVRPAGDSVLLTGTVASASEAQQAVDIANAFVGVSASAGVATKGAVINALTIRGRDQVMLQVNVVEGRKDGAKQFGINTSGNWSTLNFGNVNRSRSTRWPIPATPFRNSQPRRLFRHGNPAGVRARGRVAGAGGADPHGDLRRIRQVHRRRRDPGSQERELHEDTGRCTIGVEYKPYGVTLGFTPVVLSETASACGSPPR